MSYFALFFKNENRYCLKFTTYCSVSLKLLNALNWSSVRYMLLSADLSKLTNWYFWMLVSLIHSKLVYYFSATHNDNLVKKSTLAVVWGDILCEDRKRLCQPWILHKKKIKLLMCVIFMIHSLFLCNFLYLLYICLLFFC